MAMPTYSYSWNYVRKFSQGGITMERLLAILVLFLFTIACDQNNFQADMIRLPSNIDNSEFQAPLDIAIEQARTLTAAKTYYVSKTGSNTTGLSTSTAFRTIKQAADRVNPGDKVIVLTGVYKEVVNTTRHGTAAARIRFVSSPRWAAKIAPVKGSGVFWKNQADYNDIEGFTIDGKLDSDFPGVLTIGVLSYGKYTRIMYNNIRIYRNCTSSRYYSRGMGIDTNNYTTNVGTEIFGNIIQSSRVTGCSLVPKEVDDILYGETAGYGIYGATPYMKIYNNIVFNFRIGIHLWHNPANSVVSHNLVFNNGNPDKLTGGVGIVFGCGDKPNVTCKNITVSNNILMYNKGVFAIRETGISTLKSNRILNNVIYGMPSGQVAIKNEDQAVVSGNLVGTNPRLVNYQSNGTGDYRLTSLSPVNKCSLTGAVAKDINQGARVSGKADAGPYEYGAATPVPVAIKTALTYLVK